ncbi:hypothetical protein, partial [Methylomonas fluvii]
VNNPLEKQYTCAPASSACVAVSRLVWCLVFSGYSFFKYL